MKVLNFCKQLDILAEGVNLNVKGGKGVKSLVGSLLTAISLGMFTYTCVYLIQEYISTNSPVVVQQPSFNQNYPAIDMKANNMIPYFVVYAGGSTTSPVNASQAAAYFTFTLSYITYVQTYVNGTNTQVQTLNYTIAMPCSIVDPMPVNSTTPISIINYQQYGLCFNTSALPSTTVRGNSGDQFMSVLSLVVHPCILLTGCVSTTQSESSSFVAALRNPILNLSNYEHPLSYFLLPNQFVYVNPTITQRTVSNLGVTEVWDNNGMFSSDSLRVNYSTVNPTFPNPIRRNQVVATCNSTLILAGLCLPYYRYDYFSSGSYLKITRYYTGAIETMANIGGLRDIIFTAFIFIYMGYNRWFKKSYLVELIYKMKAERKSSKVKPWGVVDSHPPELNLGRSPSTGSELRQSYSIGKSQSKEGIISVSQEVIDHAYEVIEDSLDVVNIIKELNTLKVLTKFLMKDYHKKLVPLVALNIDINKREKRSAGKPKLCGNCKCPLSFGSKKPVPTSPERSSSSKEDYIRAQSSIGGGSSNDKAENMSVDKAYCQLIDAMTNFKTDPLDPVQAFDAQSESKVLMNQQPGEIGTLDQKLDKYCFDHLQQSRFLQLEARGKISPLSIVPVHAPVKKTTLDSILSPTKSNSILNPPKANSKKVIIADAEDWAVK